MDFIRDRFYEWLRMYELPKADGEKKLHDAASSQKSI